MSGKTVPLSARLSVDDAEFLAGLGADYGRTPSDRIRSIIAEARQRKAGADDYENALLLVNDLLAPALSAVRSGEHQHGIHSELVTRMGAWLADCVACFVSAGDENGGFSEASLRELEAGLVSRAVTLQQSVLQMAVTRKAPCYDPAVIADNIEPVLDLANVISQTRADR